MMKANANIKFLSLSLVVCAVSALPKIVFLHGGGMTSSAMQAATGVPDLVSSLSNDYEFVFAQAPEPTGAGTFNWIRDPPGGKGAATTDPNWADSSVTYLNNLNTTDGPFVGIAGYSQGSAFSTYYLARLMADHGNTKSIQFALLFCGYLPTTHSGLVATIDAQSPFANIPALIFMGEQDPIISNTMTDDQAAKFTNPTRLTSAAQAHNVPPSSDSNFQSVVDFAQAQASGDHVGNNAGVATTSAPTTATSAPTPAPAANIASKTSLRGFIAVAVGVSAIRLAGFL